VDIFLFFFLFAFRYDVGHDYNNYANIFNTIADIFNNNLQSVLILAFYEPIAILFSFIFRLTLYPYLWVIACYSFLCVFILYKLLDHYSFHTSGLLVFFALNMFAFNLDVIRQGLSILIFLYSIRYIENRNPFKYFKCVLFACCVHYSALITIPFYFILNIKLNRYFCLSLIMIFLLGYYLKIWETLREYVFSLIPHYGERFLDNELQTQSFEVSSGLGMLFNVFLSSMIVFCLNKRNKLLANMAFGGILIYLFANGNYNIERISFYLSYSLMLSVPFFFFN